jgi:hypothetical protein
MVDDKYFDYTSTYDEELETWLFLDACEPVPESLSCCMHHGWQTGHSETLFSGCDEMEAAMEDRGRNSSSSAPAVWSEMRWCGDWLMLSPSSRARVIDQMRWRCLGQLHQSYIYTRVPGLLITTPLSPLAYTHLSSCIHLFFQSLAHIPYQ